MPKGILFVMETNLPNLVMLGRTDAGSFESCMGELESAGPSSAITFKRRYAVEVDDCDSVEQTLRLAYKKLRIPSSDLYNMSPEEPVLCLSSIKGRRVYPKPSAEEVPAAKEDNETQDAPRRSRPRVTGLPDPSAVEGVKGRCMGTEEFRSALRAHPRRSFGATDGEGILHIGAGYYNYLVILQVAARYGTEGVSNQAYWLLRQEQAILDTRFSDVTYLMPPKAARAKSYSGENGAARPRGSYRRLLRSTDEPKSAGSRRGKGGHKPAQPPADAGHAYEVHTPDGKLFGCYTKREYEFLFKGKPRFKGEDGKKYWEASFEDVRPIVEGTGCRWIQADDGTFATWNDELLSQWKKKRKKRKKG